MPPHTASASGATPDPIPEEEARAYRAHLKEARKGAVLAQFHVGVCFAQGKGVARDLKEAARWYRKAAKKGLADAQYNLGLCLTSVEGGIQDAAEAAAWWRKAAEQGYAKAQFNLAHCLASGEGVPRDMRQAVVWLRKAAEQGYAQAQCNFATCLFKGEGITRDAEQAVVWYRMAAEQGLAEAQRFFGCLLLQGAGGVPKDLKEGASFVGAAAQQGNARALELLAKHAGEREVAIACCLGCGATAALQTCERCLVASFCSKACIVRTWPMHKPHCKRWQAEAKAAAESGA